MKFCAHFIPFDLPVVQWRVTESSDDGTRGLMLPYADPRAYSDRLNDVFTPAGWSRKYAVQASGPFSAADGARLRRSWLHAK